jgi:hypothetical protein
VFYAFGPALPASNKKGGIETGKLTRPQ